MSNNGEKENSRFGEPKELPEFKTEYFWAFVTVLLYKIGGVQAISLKHLELFDFEKDCPQVTWDARNEVFIMRNKEIKKQPSLIEVPGKIRKKLLKNILKHHLT
jgi:hypothetical protein